VNPELQRRISDALDAPGGLEEADAELRALLEDGETAAYARDIEAIDAALADLRPGAEAGVEELLSRIEGALDAPVEAEDVDAWLAAPFPEEAPGSAADLPAAGGGEVVSLAERRAGSGGRGAWLGAFAAAAAVLLGVGTVFVFGPTQSAEPAAGIVPVTAEEAETAEAPPAPAPSATALQQQALRAEEAERAMDLEREVTHAERDVPQAAAEPIPPPPARARRARGGGGAAIDDVDALLEGALGGATTSGAARAGSRSQDARRPTRASVYAALERIRPRATRCLGDRGEPVEVRFAMAPSGDAPSDVRFDDDVDPEVARCVRAALRAFRHAPFEGGPFDVRHVFRPVPRLGVDSASSAPATRRPAPPAGDSVADPSSGDSDEDLSGL
jgi:hypothetical protein